MGAAQQSLSGYSAVVAGVTYATLDPLNKGSSTTLSNGNLTATLTTANSTTSTIGKSTGKWYWETTFVLGADAMLGIANSSFTGVSVNTSPHISVNTNVYYNANGNKYLAGIATAYGATYAVGDILGYALDMTGGTLTIYKNNVSQGALVSSLTGTWYAVVGGASAAAYTANFGATALTYTPPTGFNAGLYH